MDKKPKKLVFFDFDGVLVDSVDIPLRIHQDANPDLHPEITARVHREMSEGNFYENIKHYPDFNWVPKEEFSRKYGAMLTSEKSPLDGMAELIHYLNGNYLLYVITSGYEIPIRNFLRKHGLLNQFRAILGAETHESKAEKFRMIFQETGILPQNAILSPIPWVIFAKPIRLAWQV